MNISNEHKELFGQMRKKLAATGPRESAFITIELVFYEALTISRSYGDNPQTNPLLNELKLLEHQEYAETRQYFKKSSQREKVIRRFIAKFKSLLGVYSKDAVREPLLQ